MKAIVYTEYGPPEVLQMGEVEKPTPKNNEMLVKVFASTVSTGVLWARTGKHPDSRLFTVAARMAFGLRRPRKPILGYEVSGIVEEVGRDVGLFEKGDQVFGTTTGLRAGAYAEYVCLPDAWRQGVVAKNPSNVTSEEAAAIPVGGMTALHNLQKANIQLGQRILIYGASGCVGTYAVQIAKAFGAEVTGVCSTPNLELVKSIGADRVIDYTKEDFPASAEYENGGAYDVVFDAVGKISRSSCKKVLKKTGTYLTTNFPTSETTEKLVFLRALVEEGKIRPVIDRRYPLEQTAEAHRYADTGHKKGNVVITVGQNVKT